ncbi:MBL fold metallo-hydrolase [candidate division WOR-3 bacterium]|uniref:MBL fold metallo-hydrolase n=1 Tax=candidate division WOR-3 bacterium TaxID=2052148 RepID=A0A9D5K926_UNCW3|nr:MBL fold metallo-hydrolase [candidate division WOR-3 bacterium]MBD3363829.1 MBL fold metallo-hydrolase [candidate division WOR-3 bacterium]
MIKEVLMKVVLSSVLMSLFLLGCGKGEKEEKVESFEIKELATDRLCITVVYDNTAYHEGLRSDWGFACVIDADGRKLLFDTGAKGDLLVGNLDKLACHPREIEKVILSHEHWDHVGGLAELLKINSDVEVYLLKSFPNKVKGIVTDEGAGLVEVSGPQVICPGIYTTGVMGRAPEEQSLIISTDKGALVITGCAHPGIVEIVQRARELTGQDILFVMGGFHLGRASDKKVKEIINEFRDMGVRYVGPCHCTGEAQIEMFRKVYGHRCLDIGVGREITGIDFMN